MDILEALKAPFPADAISWRVGATNKDKTKGIALAYIDARDVMRRFDDVCGVDWQCRYSHVTDKGVVCEIGVKIDGEWRWRSNGAGETDVEGEKGALSDAFKRAGVLWGVGRYLYDLPNEWVELDEYKRLKKTPSLPKWATPNGEAATGAAEGQRGDALAIVVKALEMGDMWAILALCWKAEQDYRFAFGRLNQKQKALCRELEQRAATLRADYLEALPERAIADDEMGVRQLWDELTRAGKELIWPDLDKTTKAYITALKDKAA
jgi:hypothetical protein